jgi:hypothetical protein
LQCAGVRPGVGERYCCNIFMSRSRVTKLITLSGSAGRDRLGALRQYHLEKFIFDDMDSSELL